MGHWKEATKTQGTPDLVDLFLPELWRSSLMLMFSA